MAAIAQRFSTRSAYFLCLPCFGYVALWALWVWNKDGRRFGTGSARELEREVEANVGGHMPAAAVGLGYTNGQVEKYEGSIKEDLEHVQKV
jgi:FHS family L-fucose permease-like MFS transporter